MVLRHIPDEVSGRWTCRCGDFPVPRHERRVRWIMQHRAEEVEASYETVPQIWAVFEQPVGFCPFCGRDLMRWYQDVEPLLRSELATGAQAATIDGPPW